MRKAMVRVEQRLDGAIAVRFQGQYVRVCRCAQPARALQPLKTAAAKPPQPTSKAQRKSDWMKNFSIRSGPSLRQAIEVSNAGSLAPAPQRKAYGSPGTTGPAIFALYLSEDRCSGDSPKQICPQKPKPPERSSYGPV